MAVSLNIGTGANGAGASTLTTSCVYAQEGATEAYRAVLANSNSPIQNELKNLASGVNTITVPTTAGGVIMQPLTSNTFTITLKGIAGDTGVLLAKTAPSILTFDNPPPATFVLTTSGIINGFRFVWF